MKVPTLLCIFLVVLFEVYAKSLDSGPKVTSTSASASVSSKSNTSPVPLQKNKKRYATKEVILYLTSSQIKALEAGKGLISPQSLPETVSLEQPNNQDVKLQEQTDFVKQEFENLKSASIQQVEQPGEEYLELASRGPLLQNEVLSTENQQEFLDQWRQEQGNQEEQLKLHNFYQELNKPEQLNLQQAVRNNGERNAWLTYSPNIQITEGYSVQVPKQNEQIVGKNEFQLKALSSLPLYIQNSERFPSQTAKPLLQLQYSPKYNDQEKAIEIEKILRTRHRHELEKQSALSQAEKIANSPAVLVHEQVKITKQHPVPVVKHVKVPVPAPVLVAAPVKVPHQYPVLQDIIKHIAVPIIQRESAEIERPVQYNVQSQIPGPVIKTIFFNVEGPYFDKKIVPVEIKAWN